MAFRWTLSLTILLVIALARSAQAGPYEDGIAALNRKDYPAMFRAFSIGASQGDIRAVTAVGIAYSYGMGVPNDYSQAVFWLTRAAQSGDAAAQTELGNLYRQGFGVAQDWHEAIRLYGLAAAQADSAAQYQLGEINYNGKVVPKNLSKAFEWYSLAAAHGNSDAQYSLGFMYAHGDGIPQDFSKAFYWYDLAAKQDNSGALLGIGDAFRYGRGAPQDFKQAVINYRAAAIMGNSLAALMLGEMYFNGQGVARDFMKSYMWHNIASAAFSSLPDFQKERDQAAAKLTPSQLARAQTMTRECIASHYTHCDLIEASNRPPTTREARTKAAPQFLKEPIASGKPQLRIRSTGSGFYVSDKGHIVTNAHVIEGCREIRSSKTGEIRKIAADSDTDLALLISTIKPTSFARLHGKGGASLGENVVAVGYPLRGILASDPIVTTGTISALAGLKNDRRKIQISAPVQPGNSGGPVLGEDGSVVGVVVGKLDAVRVAAAIGDIPQNINFAVSLGALQSFLNAHDVFYEIEQDSRVKRSSEIATKAAKYSVFLECWK